MARGSIIKRQKKDGGTTYSIKYRLPDGRQIKKAVGPTRAAAEKALTAALADVDCGKAVAAPSRETFAEAAERWLARKRPRLEASTLEDYERHLRLRLVPAFGHLPLRKLTRRHVDDYVAELDQAGALKRKTINDSLIPLRQVLGTAVREGVIATNVAVSADRDQPVELPYERPEMRHMTREEALRYLDAAAWPYRPLAEVLLASGARIGEALALTWADLDRDGHGIRINKTFKVGGTGTPKGDRARTVIVASYLFDVLDEHRPGTATKSSLIFTREDAPIRRQYVHRFWHRPTLRDAGLPIDIRVHDLRHTAATIWLASRQSIYFVQQQLGHKDIQTTIDLYGHPDREAHRQAAEQAAAWWRDTPSEGSPVLPLVPRTSRPTSMTPAEPDGTGAVG